jgi:F-type H+-transporting ATPase subunit epsilon
MSLQVQIVTPAKVAWTGEVSEAQVPGFLGEFGALPNHAAMLAVTRAGVITLHSSDGTQRLVIGPGFAEVGPAELTLLVASCEEADSVDKAAAQAALTAAEGALASADAGSEAWKQAQAAIELATARIDA